MPTSRAAWPRFASVPALIALPTLSLGLTASAAELPMTWGNLEGDWLFRTDPDDVGEGEGWASADHDDDAWQTLRVPGYWEAQGVTDPRPGQPPKPKDGLPWTDYDGVAWYRLRFVVPENWAGQELVLHLGSVDDQDRTFLNGDLVGETGPGITNAVSVKRVYRVSAERARFGEENVLALRVYDGGGPGGFMGPLVSLLPATMAEAPIQLPTDDRPLADRFATPPASCRMLKIIHSWPDAPEGQDMLIRSLASQGFGGVACNVSFTEYLQSEERWEAFVRAVTEAKQAGMSLWLYDERGYPSGAAGGLTLQDHPEWEARGLLIADAEVEAGPVSLDLPPGELLLAAAFPVGDSGIDLARQIDLSERIRGGKLTWEAPEGRWHAMTITQDRLYEGTHAAHSLADKLPYINLLMPEPTARFIELTHQEYANHLGDDLGEWFVSTFTDEPSLMGCFMRPMPYRVLPWAPDLPREFRERRGYDLPPKIPALVTDAGPDTPKVRYDFWQTIGELVSESYFGQIQDFCHQHGFGSGGHLLIEESLRSHVPYYGDFFRCVRRLDAPSIDCLTSLPAQVPWRIARLIGSAADLEGKPVTMCETSDFGQWYRPEGDERPVYEVTEHEIRGTCNRLILGGINTITSYYRFTGLSGEELRRLNDCVGRCCTMLRGGHQVTDIAVLYPVESVWPHFTPARSGPTASPDAARIDRTFNNVSQSLYTACRDFTYIDSRTLAEARVDGDSLVHNDLRWRVVILPAADTLPLAAWRNLARFWRGGGIAIAVGSRPQNSEREFPAAEVLQLAEAAFGQGDEPRVTTNEAGGVGIFLPSSAEALLPVVLDSVIEADVGVADGGSPIRATHRRLDGQEVYFLINDSAHPVETQVSFAATGPGERWDISDGTMAAVPAAQDISLPLGPYGATVLRFPAARSPQRRPVEPGPLPGLTLRPLPAVEPSMGHGEFVRGELSADAAHSEPDRPAWRAAATLTKSDVDTFLFLSFAYPDTLDLTEAECLAIDTWVPDGQRTPTQVLVMLHEGSGADYLAITGRALGAPGHARSFVLLSRFDLAGWTEDPDGRLDLADITRVSVGWGGYFGEEDETIELSLASPQVARRQGDQAH